MLSRTSPSLIFKDVGMKALARKYLVFLLSAAMLGVTARPARSQPEWRGGKRTAGEAAAPGPVAAPGFAARDALDWAYADTTDYEFPEDEERKHLWRDVALWVVVAGFVAYFVIKVFLEEEPDGPTPEDPGKDPPASLSVPRPDAWLRPAP
jgi:hypothetical protein